MKRLFALLVLAAALGTAACGQGDRITVEGAVYRAPLVDGAPGVAYFSIRSETADRIVALSSPQAAAVEIHASENDGGMASMEKIDAVELPAGKTVTFGPQSLHVMVLSPVARAANATFSIQITLGSGEVRTISFADAQGAQ